MRVILDPDGDAALPSGRTLADLRPELARLTGRKEWTTAPVTLDGHPLADDHVSGVPPWVAGTVLATRGPDGVPARVEDDGGPWRLVVLDGPDAGATRTAPGHDRVVLGRGTGPDDAPRARTRGTALTLADPLVSRTHAVVRRHRHGWTVRDLASANGTTLLTGEARRRPRRRSWRSTPMPSHLPRRARPGDALRLGSTVVLLDGPAPPPSRTATALRAARHPSVLIALVGGLLIAALTRNAVFLAFALLAPLSALAARAGAATGTGGPGTHEVSSASPTASTDPGGASDRPAGPDGPHRALGRLPVVAGLPLLVDARDATRRTPDRDAPPPWWGLAQDGLAVTGPEATTVAHALVLGALADPGRRLTALLGAPGWDWLRWAEKPLASTRGAGARVARTCAEVVDVLTDVPAEPLLVIDVAGSAWRPDIHRWFGRRRTEDAVVVVVPPGTEPPPWCRWTLTTGLAGRPGTTRTAGRTTTTPAGPGAGAVLSGPGTRRPVIAPPVTAAVAEAVARARAPGWTPGRASVPDVVGWADLHLPDTADDVLDAWARSGGDVVARVGLGRHGRPVDVDLRRDGPHALVAGTTGAGKSELLQTLLLSLATTHPPHELAVVLVDYKGGAGFGDCTRLPHVVGTVTDLDTAGSARALAALRTELRRREHLLAAAKVADLEALRRTGADAPPRLLVLVDEFRALVEDLPDFVPGLVRVATQGRSLGVHLVLATQRPAGVVDAQLRANLPLRVCLRVADRTDSLDVVETPDAASIPADRPGRALLHRAGGAVEPVQTAWAALAAGGGDGTLAAGGADGVRWARPWAAFGPRARSVVRADPDAVARRVDTVRAAHRRTGRPAPDAPWLPPLPAVVRAHELLATGRGDALPLALADLPEERRRGTVTWDPAEGALLVAGGPSSGRTTALRTVTHAALAAGHAAHVVAGGERAAWVGGAPGGGTVVGPDEPGRLARLLDRLLDGVGRPTVVVVDDVVAAQRALALLPRGAGDGLLDRLVREGRQRGLSVALAGTPADVVRYLPQAALRLVLALPDPNDARLIGTPSSPGGPHGRAMALGGRPGGAVLCQIVSGTRPPGGAVADPGDDGPTVLVPLPRLVTGARPEVLGLGTDRGVAVVVPTGSVLVAGPARSGRSTALARLAAAHRARGHRVVTSLTDHDDPRPTVLVLDDLDLRLRRDPGLDERLVEHVTTPAAPHAPVAVLAAARTDRVAGAYRGALAALRETTVLLLDPTQPGSADVAGADLALHADPTQRMPGRGVLVTDGRIAPIQVASS